MKLVLRTKRVKTNEEFEVPDNSFDFMFSGIADEVDVMYLVLVKDNV